MDHRDDSTFSFDPSNLDVKRLDKNNKKKIDSRKGVLLSSYSRKKTRRRKTKSKDGKDSNGNSKGGATPTPTPSPRVSDTPPVPLAPAAPPARPQVLAVPINSPRLDTLRPENALGKLPKG